MLKYISLNCFIFFCGLCEDVIAITLVHIHSDSIGLSGMEQVRQGIA